MKKKLAFGLLALLAVLAVPAVTTPTTASEETAPVVATDLAVDEFLFEGLVTTEAVAAQKCPAIAITCGHPNQDCGVEPGRCHCKAGGGTLTCVGTPQ